LNLGRPAVFRKGETVSHFRRPRAACLLGIFALALGAGCSSIDVQTQHLPSVDFSAYRTYRWAPGKILVPGKPVGIDQRVVETIDRTLATKGLKKQDGATDLVVTYYIGVKEALYTSTEQAWSFGLGTGARGITYERGRLIVWMLDPRLGRDVWRGEAIAPVEEQGSKPGEQLKRAVAAMFEDFPPKK